MKSPGLINSIRSSVIMLISWTLLSTINWLLTELGAVISDFNGDIYWYGVEIKASANHWLLGQVLWLFLFPYLGMVLIYFIFSINHVPRKLKSSWLQFFLPWGYLFSMVWVFVVPIFGLIQQTGIYYALSWLHVDRVIQYSLLIFLFLAFLIRVFRLGPLFSLTLSIPMVIKSRAVVWSRLWSLIWLPFILWSFLIIVITPSSFSSYSYLVLGVFFILILNTGLILRYDVIVNE